MDRRTLIGAGLLTAAVAGASTGASAQTPVEDAPTLPIWPKGPPGGEKVTAAEEVIDRTAPNGVRDRAIAHTRNPMLTVFRPSKPNGGAALIFPGGGYIRAVMDKEGFEPARWLAARGYTAFVASYRMPADGWASGPNAPLQDAQRALRLVRSKAAAMGFAPDRVSIQGYSAGGHLAASLLTRFDETVYEPIDSVDALSARPDAGCLMYPVISMKPGLTHGGSRTQLLGATPTPEQIAHYSAEMRVTANTPPTLLIHAADDGAVPVENSIAMLTALRAAKVAAEMHLFEEGGHGFGMRGIEGRPVGAWPDLWASWLKKRFP